MKTKKYRYNSGIFYGKSKKLILEH